jgi:hypothetical protein
MGSGGGRCPYPQSNGPFKQEQLLSSRTSALIRIFAVVALLIANAACQTGSMTTVTAPSIATQPQPQSVAIGQTATFSATANGTSPFTFQWQKNNTNIMSNANSATYTTPATQAGDNGSTYRVIVSNSAGSATSNAAMLSVVTPTKPGITTQPASQTVAVGATATFTVVASGSGPLTYQWIQGTTNITNSNSPSFTTPATKLSDSGETFKVMVSNSAGSITSNPATLTVISPPGITTQPTNQSVAVGATATFTVVASGTTPLTYQWIQGTTNIANSNSPSFTTAATKASDNGETFKVKVTNAAGSITSNPATLTVISPPGITTQPMNQSVFVGATASFTVVASGTAPLTYQWIQGTTNIANSNSPSFTTGVLTANDSGETFKVKVTNTAGSITSNSATLTVTTPVPGTANVLTYHNDNARTGLNPNETILTMANVKSATFGKIGFFSTLEGNATQALVDAEPLYVSNLTVAGASHNVLYVATEHDTVFAFDADTGAQLWKMSLLGTNETPSDTRGCGQVTPEIGITSTPVIDLKAGPHGTIFVVAMSKNGSNYFQRLHALDLTTGGEIGTPTVIQATFNKPGHAGQVATFDPKQYKERSALLLLNGVIYTTWASHCDIGPYQAWIMGYSESTLLQTSVLNVTPNGSDGAFWGAGAGPAADSSGNFYVLSGNGTFDGTLDGNMFPVNADFGNGFLKISPSANTLSVSDYFMMHDSTSESNGDVDLGSGGPMVLPDLKDNIGNTWHLAVGAGKDQRIYVVNRDLMGKFNTPNDAGVYQEIPDPSIQPLPALPLPGGVWSTSAYFNNAVYYGSVGNHLQAFTISNAKLSTTASSKSSTSFGYPGATPSISANGTTNGILWAMENGNPGTLHAYDATNLATELYNSNQAAGGRDQYPTNSACKFVTPVIASGKVFAPTATGVAVFGLLP